MTPDMANSVCKNNPSEGPLAASCLSARIAGLGWHDRRRAGTQGLWRGGGGRRVRVLVERPSPYDLQFTIRAGSQYTDAEGHAGSFKFAPSNSRIQFIGGNLSDLGKDYVIIYHEPAGHG